MDADIEEDDEEDDIKNMRETMMSILEDGNSDGELDVILWV